MKRGSPKGEQIEHSVTERQRGTITESLNEERDGEQGKGGAMGRDNRY